MKVQGMKNILASFLLPYVKLDFCKIGRISAELAMDLLAGKSHFEKTVTIEPEFVFTFLDFFQRLILLFLELKSKSILIVFSP